MVSPPGPASGVRTSLKGGTNVVGFFKRMISPMAPAVRDGNVADADSVRRFCRVLGVWVLVLTVFQAVGVPFIFVRKSASAWLGGIELLATLAAYWLARRGRWRVGCWILLTVNWSIVTFLAAFSGGLVSIIPIYYVVISVASGWLIGKRAVFLFSGLSCVAGTVMTVWGAVAGDLPKLFPEPPAAAWLNFVIAMTLVTVPYSEVLRSLGRTVSLTERQGAQLRSTAETLRDTEAQRLAIFKASRDAMFLAEIEAGVLVDANPAAEVLCGRSLEEIRSLHHTQLHPPGSAERARRGFEKASHDQGLAEGQVLHKDGRLIPVEIVASELASPDGRRLLLGVFRDTTERTAAQHALWRSEERFRQVAESAGEFIWEVDADGLYTYASPVVEQILGYSPEEVVGKKYFYDFFAPETRERMKAAAFEEFARHGLFRAFPNSNVRKDGRTVILETSGVPVIDATGRLLGYRGADTDVTERKRAEEVLAASEEKYRALVEATDTGYLILDEEGRVVDANREYVRLSGHRELGEILGRSVIEWTAAHEQQTNAEAVARCVKDGFIRNLVVDYVDRNNRVTPVEINAKVIGDGNSIRIISLCRDVTERKRAEQHLQASEARLLEAQRLAKVGSWEVDVETDRLQWSSEMFRIYGMSDPAPSNFPALLSHILPEDRARLLEADRQVRSNISPAHIEYRVVRPDGDVRSVHSIFEAIRNDQGKLVRIAGATQDITDRRRAEEQAAARQKLETVGTLASGIAHDFNNLLGGILAQSELALDEFAAGREPGEELQAIQRAALRGSEIVRQLMTYAGKESEALELADLSRIVREMIELVQVSVSKQAVVEVDLAEGLPAVRVSPAQLRQVVLNLVTNASDAIGDRRGVIRVATSRVAVDRDSSSSALEPMAEGDYLRLEVSDTGRGMSPETQARVYDPFFTTKTGGHGLGLAVVQGIVRGLRGAIQLASEPGKGTTVSVLLPCAEAVAGTSREPASSTEAPAPPSRGATVLVVEDEDPLRQAIVRRLRSTGFEVLEAADGRTAIDLLRADGGKIDLILLDMTIPGPSSHQVVAEAAQARPDVRVVLTSAYSQEMVTANMNEPQIRDFVRKPFQLGDLVQTLRNAMS
jgi:two-component system, cell cycle sensor histidine kinase and response regulator CckA